MSDVSYAWKQLQLFSLLYGGCFESAAPHIWTSIVKETSLLAMVKLFSHIGKMEEMDIWCTYLEKYCCFLLLLGLRGVKNQKIDQLESVLYSPRITVLL